MPLRREALTPGEFIRDHLAAGHDYVQSIFRAYKEHLKDKGIKHKPSRASFSKYIWVANELGLITFAKAKAPERWGATEDGTPVVRGYKKEDRPQAPSPRHYYELAADVSDPRWFNLERSWRESMGLPPPPPPKPKPKAEAKPVGRPPKPKKVKKVKEKPQPAQKRKEKLATVEDYETWARDIAQQLKVWSKNPSSESLKRIEDQLMTLGESVLSAVRGAKGKERDRLGMLNSNVLRSLENLPTIKTPLETYEKTVNPDQRKTALEGIAAGIKVLNNNLTLGLPKQNNKKKKS